MCIYVGSALSRLCIFTGIGISLLSGIVNVCTGSISSVLYIQSVINSAFLCLRLCFSCL